MPATNRMTRCKAGRPGAIAAPRAPTRAALAAARAGATPGMARKRRGLLITAAVPVLALSMLAPALAWTDDASPWDSGHASQARLIAGLDQRETYLAGLEIALAEGYKTYWRHAGDSGLPPEIDWSESRNVADLSLAFPAPGRFTDASGIFFGYENAVVFPLDVTPRDPDLPMDLVVALSYGVCKDICIPAFATLSLTLEPNGDGAHAARLTRALERVPAPVAFGESRDGLALVDYRISGNGALEVLTEAPDGALLMAEGPDFRWFLDPAEQAVHDPQSGLQVFSVDFAETPRAIEDDARFRFTLVDGDHGIEAHLDIDVEDLRRLAR